MGDRELRDEIEVLYGQLKAERAKADAPQDEVLARARTALKDELAELTERRKTLEARLAELQTLRRERKRETATAKSELADARSEIAEREPLGNPLAESRSNWELEPDTNPGCAPAVLLLAGGALSTLAWWLRSGG